MINIIHYRLYDCVTMDDVQKLKKVLLQKQNIYRSLKADHFAQSQ